MKAIKKAIKILNAFLWGISMAIALASGWWLSAIFFAIATLLSFRQFRLFLKNRIDLNTSGLNLILLTIGIVTIGDIRDISVDPTNADTGGQIVERDQIAATN